MCSLQGVYTSRGVPRIANAARAGHGRGPYAVRRIGRGVTRFGGAAVFPKLQVRDAECIPQAILPGLQIRKDRTRVDAVCVGVPYFPG